MFAGPNGSGKSTIKSVIGPELLGIYINPDDLEKEIKISEFIPLDTYEITSSQEEILYFFRNSPLLKPSTLAGTTQALRFDNNRIYFDRIAPNPYFATVTADFIRNKLLETNKSFSFETVMSHPDKIEFLRKAQKLGYRTYLYYVATASPEINMSRVQYRVKMGGHTVPEDKITSRYYNSLSLLKSAVQHSNRAYIFDNSNALYLWVAEITEGKFVEVKTDELPLWVKTFLLDNLPHTKD
ncbi:MAG: hypothetical protein FJZ63_04035 [Chlamydiae bacterium]|nr:hypothetical protein [Chlamydiota bacterium]